MAVVVRTVGMVMNRLGDDISRGHLSTGVRRMVRMQQTATADSLPKHRQRSKNCRHTLKHARSPMNVPLSTVFHSQQMWKSINGNFATTKPQQWRPITEAGSESQEMLFDIALALRLTEGSDFSSAQALICCHQMDSWRSSAMTRAAL